MLISPPPQPQTVSELVKGLKSFYRRGYQLSGIPDEKGESTWTHSQRLKNSLLIHARREGLEEKWLVPMAVWHDTSDYLRFDITPHDNIDHKEQVNREWQGVIWATANLGAAKETIRTHWLRANVYQSPQKNILHQFDKMEAYVESLRYGETFPHLWDAQPYPLNRFYAYTRNQLTSPMLLRIIDTLNKRTYPYDARVQYHTLLKNGGDVTAYHESMERLSIDSKQPRIVDVE
jgi:5'-deoxynucleotidase YfbR-like HD superfamily hydrolase